MTVDPPPFPDYYEVLGVEPGASESELRAARREASKRWHPDRNSAPEAEGMMRLVNAAWEVLGRADTRAEYDVRYFAWKSEEYARRARAADEVRMGYDRERLEREGNEVRGAGPEDVSEEWNDHWAGGSSSGDARDADMGDGESDAKSDQSVQMDSTAWWVLGIVLGVFLAIAVIVGGIAWYDAERQSERTATATARFYVSPTPDQRALQSVIGDESIECVSVLFGNHARFWASVKFRVPTSSSWSVGFLYHNPALALAQGLDTDTATFLYRTRSGGPYVGHWTREADANVHRAGPRVVSPSSALNAAGMNVMRIEVNERGSFLILNGELQIHVPAANLRVNPSPVKLCVGLFTDEASEYELRYSDLTGGSR